VLKCPKCDKDFESLGGLKAHLKRKHGGYTNDELQAALQSDAEATPVVGYSSVEDFAKDLPEDAQQAQANGSAEQPQPNVKKFRADMRKLKRIFAETLPKQIFHAIAMRTGDSRWELDYEEQQTIAEAVGASVEMFGLELQFEGRDIVLRSRWWALLIPLAAIGTVLAAKSTLLVTDEKPAEAQREPNATQ
jgi:hypothetical protein